MLVCGQDQNDFVAWRKQKNERETARKHGQSQERKATSELLGLHCPGGEIGANANNTVSFQRQVHTSKKFVSEKSRTKRRPHKSAYLLCSKKIDTQRVN
jgi:hypothetical protein